MFSLQYVYMSLVSHFFNNPYLWISPIQLTFLAQSTALPIEFGALSKPPEKSSYFRVMWESSLPHIILHLLFPHRHTSYPARKIFYSFHPFWASWYNMELKDNPGSLSQNTNTFLYTITPHLYPPLLEVYQNIP